MRTVVRPAELDFETVGRRDYFVALEHDSIWGDHLIPLTVIVGPEAKPGEGLVAFGASHGNEYEGPIAIRHLIRQIDTSAVKGRLVLVPVLNPAALRAGARESTLDDRVNLNRAFVEGAGKVPAIAGITHRIADFVRQAIWPHVHVVIDLHAGGNVARFALCASFHEVADQGRSKRIEETARWFGTPVVLVYQNQTPGLLTSEAERLGKITIGAELGWGEAAQTAGVRHARHGVLAAAIHAGQMAGRVEPIAYQKDGTQVKAAIVDRACFTVSTLSGYYEPLVDCGQRVEAGTTLGLIHDFERIDADPWRAVTDVAGVVVAQAWRAHVRQGQHVAIVGRILPWRN